MIDQILAVTCGFLAGCIVTITIMLVDRTAAEADESEAERTSPRVAPRIWQGGERKS